MRNPYQSKKNKYGVSPKEERTYNGIVFDSKAEMKRYKDLELLEKAGQIKELQRQEAWVLQEPFEYKGKKIRAIYYIADFSYYENGKYVVEDVKGRKTKEYQLKKKMFLKRYQNIDFREVS
jgi:hypothetical protein